ncbi:MAG: non-ribosomal peptide synthase, partial [bacterium]|nr:non-ribosomal peptide synthase [bacterium]
MYNNTRDVVFGAVVSGRPVEIQGVEDIVGLFINTIPVRITIDPAEPFTRLLEKVQGRALDSEPHHYYPLAESQTHTPLRHELIDHIMVFENYPVDERIQRAVAGAPPEKESAEPLFRLSRTEMVEQTDYDFNVMVLPLEHLEIKFEY